MDSAGTYILNFASVVLGLALGDMLLDLDRLLRPHVKVRWHPLPVIAAAFVLVVIVAAWWELYFISSVKTVSVAHFLPYFLKLVLIFLLAAAVLPSEWHGAVDLREYYFDNHRRLFGTWFALSNVILFMPSLLYKGWPPLGIFLWNAKGLVGMGVLAFTRKPIVHWLILPTLFVLFTWQWLSATIGS